MASQPAATAEGLTPGALSRFLATGTSARKTVWRPYICPFHRLLPYVPPGASVYDVGCGGGAWLALAARFRSAGRLGGYDVSEAPVAGARQLLAALVPAVPAEVSVWTGSGVRPLLSGYDCVSVIDVLHHVPASAQREFLAASIASLRSGAVLILKDIDRASPLVALNKLHDLALAGAPGAEWTEAEALAAVAQPGLEIIARDRVRMAIYPHYWIVARRR